MIAVAIDKPGLKIARKLLVEAKELEESELSGFDKNEIQTLKETLRNLVRHCSNRGVLDNSSEAAGQIARTNSNNRSATRQRS